MSGVTDIAKSVGKSGLYALGSRLAPTFYNMARNYAQYRLGSRSGRQTARGRRTKSGRSFTQTKTRKKRMRGGQGVTEQYDRRLIYAKSSMPRFKKRRWKRFKQKVNAISEKELGTRMVVFNTPLSFANDQTTRHITATFALYPARSSAVYLNDIDYIGRLGNQSNPTHAEGPSMYGSSKILFQSGVLDLTIQNRSSLDTAGTRTFPGECKMEVDIYEITASRDFYYHTSPSTTTFYNNLSDLLNYSQTFGETLKDNNTSPSTDEIDIGDRGVTPFECNFALSRFGVKIWKKTKFMLNINETITYQMRDPRRRVLNQLDETQTNGCNRPGWTKFVFVIGKLVPGCTPIQASNGYTERISVGVTRKYFFKVEGQTEDRSLYVPQ